MIKTTGRLYLLLSTITAWCLCTQPAPGNLGANNSNGPPAPVISDAIEGDGSVTVSWEPVKGAVSYNLYYSKGTAVNEAGDTELTEVTSPARVAGLSNGTVYTFAVSAQNVSGESALSEGQTLTPQAPGVFAVDTSACTAEPPPGMKCVPGGTFVMGSDDPRDDGADPSHLVVVSSFFMDSTEVTQGSYAAIMDTNPSYFSIDSSDTLLPVEQVSWYDAVRYCMKRSDSEGLQQCYDTAAGAPNWTCDITKNGYRLPTEAEWEYACRAGSTTAYWWGNDTTGMGARAWTVYNSGYSTQPVATRLPDTLDLYDMTGNVWEWCNDWWGDYSANEAANPTGPLTGTYRIVRGGSWYLGLDVMRCALRNYNLPNEWSFWIGFRCVRSR